MYKIDVDKSRKLFLVRVGGFFKDDEAEQFIQDYLKEFKAINPAEYELVLDCKELSVSGKDMVPVLKERLEMYISQGYKKVYFVKLNSAVGMLQLKKVGVESGFWDKVTTVDSADEIMN